MSSVMGNCLCGQITVLVSKEVFIGDRIGLCHCENCRQASGSLGSINLIVLKSNVKIIGQPKIYHDSNTESNNIVQRAFCGNCGCPIYNETPKVSNAYIIKLGLFHEIPKPSTEAFCKRRTSWEKPIDGAEQYEGMIDE